MFIYTDDVGASVLILFIDYCHKRAYYTYIGNYNTVISSHNEKIIVKLADGIFHRYFIPIINRVWMGFYASVDSNCNYSNCNRPHFIHSIWYYKNAGFWKYHKMVCKFEIKDYK